MVLIPWYYVRAQYSICLAGCKPYFNKINVAVFKLCTFYLANVPSHSIEFCGIFPIENRHAEMTNVCINNVSCMI